MTPGDPFAFAGMSDRQVIEKAATHLQNAARLPPGTQRRAVETAKFWAAYDEFGRREAARVICRVSAL
jgi:hypothetical protein